RRGYAPVAARQMLPSIGPALLERAEGRPGLRVLRRLGGVRGPHASGGGLVAAQIAPAPHGHEVTDRDAGGCVRGGRCTPRDETPNSRTKNSKPALVTSNRFSASRCSNSEDRQ